MLINQRYRVIIVGALLLTTKCFAVGEPVHDPNALPEYPNQGLIHPTPEQLAKSCHHVYARALDRLVQEEKLTNFVHAQTKLYCFFLRENADAVRQTFFAVARNIQ